MVYARNLQHCNNCINKIPIRQFATNVQRMQAKSVVVNQWKLLNYLNNYLGKFVDRQLFENVINRQFALFLQKVQPKIYGNVQTSALPTKIDDNDKKTTTLPSVFTELKLRLTNGNEKKIVETVPKWKTQAKISKESISARTEYLITQITSTQSDESLIQHLEEFNNHLKQYQEAKHSASKVRATPILLQIKNRTQNDEVQCILRETFALLGHVHPVPGAGVRILSIDGGGVRGILVIEMLRKLEELSGKSVHDMFDLICGVSTGAIIASLIGVKRYTLDETLEIYKGLSTKIFSQSALKGTSNLVWSHSYYDTALWEQLLKEEMGEETLIGSNRNPKCPKLCAVSSVVNQSRLSAYLFRNYSLPCHVESQYMGSHEHLVWEAVRASAAAPTYFEEFKLGNLLHQDGGVLYNNPTAVAIHEAKLLWPETPLACVLSFGTGRIVHDPHATTVCSSTNSSWKHKLNAIIESATDTEGVHTLLSDLLPPNVYYRFNPYLTEMLDIAEIDPDKMVQLERDAVMYLRRNEDKFHEAAKALNTPKGLCREVIDWLKTTRMAYG